MLIIVAAETWGILTSSPEDASKAQENIIWIVLSLDKQSYDEGAYTVYFYTYSTCMYIYIYCIDHIWHIHGRYWHV